MLPHTTVKSPTFVLFVFFVAQGVVPSVAAAQWLRHPTAGIPRTADGKPHLSAPAPRTADGKPDISGLWRPAEVLVGDIALKLPSGSVPFQPWAEELYKQRR